LQPVVGGYALRLGCEPGAPQRCPEPIARAVPGENPPGAVATVCRRSKPYHDEAGSGVAETWYGTTPINLLRIRCAAFGCHRLAPLDQARAPPASHFLLA
jgi:hypothetical protein